MSTFWLALRTSNLGRFRLELKVEEVRIWFKLELRLGS